MRATPAQNYSLNKDSEDFVDVVTDENMQESLNNEGSKRSLTVALEQLKRDHVRVWRRGAGRRRLRAHAHV